MKFKVGDIVMRHLREDKFYLRNIKSIDEDGGQYDSNMLNQRHNNYYDDFLMFGNAIRYYNLAPKLVIMLYGVENEI